MYIRRNSAFKYCTGVVIGVVLYSEYFVYMLQSWHWQDLSCPSNDWNCTKILFIADPQIQGDEAAPWPWNSIFSWDSDRYLRKTFKRVIGYFKPDVLVYLGDLTDEGSISTVEQFNVYLKRVADIFEVAYPVVQVWSSGDNDIGGENEPIKWDKVTAFNVAFEQPSVVLFRNLSFYIVNAITHETGHLMGLYDKGMDPIEKGSLRIVVSHYPLMIRPAFMKKLDAYIKPNIYFCAHDHESKFMIRDPENENHFKRTVPFYGEIILKIPFNVGYQYEIYVPTCSYRMGTSNIGYGAGILDNNNEQMRYTVFWSPRRFPYLFGYLVIASLLGIFGLVFCAVKVHYSVCHTYKRANMLLRYSKL